MVVDLEQVLTARAAQRATAILQQWPDTMPVVRAAEPEAKRGCADPIGDDQAERCSAWGALDECAAVEGGVFAGPAPSVRSKSRPVLIVCAAVFAAAIFGALVALWARA